MEKLKQGDTHCVGAASGDTHVSSTWAVHPKHYSFHFWVMPGFLQLHAQLVAADLSLLRQWR